MKGNKHTYIQDKTFYKQHTDNEFLFLKILHDMTGLEIKTDNYYISMPADHVISIDTIPKNKRINIKNIIIENIPFILKQIQYLTAANINYSDCLQFLYHNNKLYLIDFDTAYFNTNNDSYNKYNNYDLLSCFLSAFDINTSIINDCMHYLTLFQHSATFDSKEQQLLDKLQDDTMLKNHVYYSKNARYIQADVKNIQLLTDNCNVYITETILPPAVRDEWELIQVV